jgi:ribose transport system permease protein
VLTCGIDLSVGPVISLTTAIVSTSLHPLLAVTVAFLAGIAIGIVNGIGVTSLRIHPIVMTLVSGIFVQAIALIVRGVPGGTVSASIKWLNSGNAAGIPAPIFAILGLILVAYIVLYVSPLGIHIFAVGANRQYADLNGVKTYRVLTKTYVLSSCFAVFAGLVVAARIGSGFAYAGESFTLDSITAVALGGTSIVGGAGSLWGTVSAIITLSVLGNGMNLANLSAYIQQLVKGLILLVVISLQGRERFGL